MHRISVIALLGIRNIECYLCFLKKFANIALVQFKPFIFIRAMEAGVI